MLGLNDLIIVSVSVYVLHFIKWFFNLQVAARSCRFPFFINVLNKNVALRWNTKEVYIRWYIKYNSKHGRFLTFVKHLLLYLSDVIFGLFNPSVLQQKKDCYISTARFFLIFQIRCAEVPHIEESRKICKRCKRCNHYSCAHGCACVIGVSHQISVCTRAGVWLLVCMLVISIKIVIRRASWRKWKKDILYFFTCRLEHNHTPTH